MPKSTDKRAVLLSLDEVALKSVVVRKILERMVASHVNWFMREHGLGNLKVRNIAGRLVIDNVSDARACAELASKVLGIAYAMPAFITEPSLEAIAEKAVEVASRAIEVGETFAVRAHRVGEHPFKSRDIEVVVGREILTRLSERGLKVDLENPDKTFYIEVRPGRAYVYTEKMRGPGGLPVGSQGRLVAILNTGLALLASFMMIKRGSLVIPLHFDFGIEGSIVWAGSASKVLKSLVPTKRFSLLIAPVADAVKVVMDNSPTDIAGPLVWRLVYKVAELVALKHKALGLVVDSRLSSDQLNLKDLGLIEEVTRIPVYQPLLGLLDEDIAELVSNIPVSIDQRLVEASYVPMLLKRRCGADIKELHYWEEELRVGELARAAFTSIRKTFISG